jgi:hypothetical protein
MVNREHNPSQHRRLPDFVVAAGTALISWSALAHHVVGLGDRTALEGDRYFGNLPLPPQCIGPASVRCRVNLSCPTPYTRKSDNRGIPALPNISSVRLRIADGVEKLVV